MKARGALRLLLVLVAGLAALWLGTDGFAAFTSEGARRSDVARTPRLLAPIELKDHEGRTASLEAHRGKVVIMDFIYTRCPTLCIALGSSFERLRQEINRGGLSDRVVLVSVSFDIRNDGPAELADYARRHGGADRVWRFVRPRSQDQLARLLRITEVIVLPDEVGGFVHNAAIHIVDRDGRLRAIVDTEDVGGALAIARRLL